MEGKQINYFSSTSNFGKQKASPPISPLDKGKPIDPLSYGEIKINKDGANTAPSASIFSKLFYEKIEADGAALAPSL